MLSRAHQEHKGNRPAVRLRRTRLGNRPDGALARPVHRRPTFTGNPCGSSSSSWCRDCPMGSAPEEGGIVYSSATRHAPRLPLNDVGSALASRHSLAAWRNVCGGWPRPRRKSPAHV